MNKFPTPAEMHFQIGRVQEARAVEAKYQSIHGVRSQRGRKAQELRQREETTLVEMTAGKPAASHAVSTAVVRRGFSFGL